ncbi:hypothetical protein MTAT_20310 [Moorella thermoacetica]|uniref:PhoH-like protein n=1 Tax=Neomoorella thermoacetica TaxID=1525 RepID=A0AAC9HJ41_NEOTH|nr:PhoH family protein [Moorella thermoacetica]AOQ24686.1 PhoH-like protein [Moorella thermoacetica]TYL12789.1 hypothetical protein MTAT_20310 [Moorella thermoacetica]
MYQHYLNIDDETAAAYYQYGLEALKPFLPYNLYENSHLLFFLDEKPIVLAKWQDSQLKPVKVPKLWGINFDHNLEQTFAVHDLLDDKIQLLCITGNAGTGKTFISLLAGLYQTRKHKFNKVLFTREPLSVGQHIGILPGSAEEKIRDYMKPAFDNLLELTDNDLSFSDLLNERLVEFEAVALMRGRTLTNTFFIIDECQNFDVHVAKTLISRAGKGTKVVMLGSFKQIDNPRLSKDNNGLARVIAAFSGQPLFSHVVLYQNERSHLAQLADELL